MEKWTTIGLLEEILATLRETRHQNIQSRRKLLMGPDGPIDVAASESWTFDLVDGTLFETKCQDDHDHSHAGQAMQAGGLEPGWHIGRDSSGRPIPVKDGPPRDWTKFPGSGSLDKP